MAIYQVLRFLASCKLPAIQHYCDIACFRLNLAVSLKNIVKFLPSFRFQNIRYFKMAVVWREKQNAGNAKPGASPIYQTNMKYRIRLNDNTETVNKFYKFF